MHNSKLIEKCYQKYMEQKNTWSHENLIHVDIDLLKRFNLLINPEVSGQDSALNRYFHVIESQEKITLINEEFVIWIVPERENNVNMTYGLIALNKEKGEPQLEVVFAAAGVYNTSFLVLRVLEKLLQEIQENEDVLKGLK